MTTKTQQAEDAETETEDTTAEGEDDQGGGGLTLEALDAKIDALTEKITRALRGGPRKTAQDGNPDVAAQVREEVTKIAASEGRRKEREDRIGALEAKVEKLAEKPPREYRQITKILWGEDDD